MYICNVEAKNFNRAHIFSVQQDDELFNMCIGYDIFA